MRRSVDSVGAAAFALVVIPFAVFGAVALRVAATVSDLCERWQR